MAKKKPPKMVNCRYPKCRNLHETTELKKEDAVKGGSKNSYYHPDCWHTMQTVNAIRDTFCKQVNTMMTGQQIGQLVSIVNNMIFSKGIDVDYIKFALDYFIKYKPGALKYPGGIAYIVQNRDVDEAWKKEQEKIIKDKIKEQQNNMIINDEFQMEQLDIPDDSEKIYKTSRKRFSDILGV